MVIRDSNMVEDGVKHVYKKKPKAPKLDVLIVRSGKIVRNQQDSGGVPPARDLDPNDPAAASNASRPQRQCTTRSLAYRFVEQNSEDEED